MMPKETVYDIMKRTIFNLKFIEQHKNREGPYEITQLLNSFMGAVAHPWEKYKKELNSITLDEAHAIGWPAIEKERRKDRDPENLGDLIRLIRNGLAHGNITPYPDPNDEIRSVLIWNINRSNVRDWGAVLTVEVLRDLLFKFVELSKEIHYRDVGNIDDSA